MTACEKFFAWLKGTHPCTWDEVRELLLADARPVPRLVDTWELLTSCSPDYVPQWFRVQAPTVGDAQAMVGGTNRGQVTVQRIVYLGQLPVNGRGAEPVAETATASWQAWHGGPHA